MQACRSLSPRAWLADIATLDLIAAQQARDEVNFAQFFRDGAKNARLRRRCGLTTKTRIRTETKTDKDMQLTSSCIGSLTCNEPFARNIGIDGRVPNRRSLVRRPVARQEGLVKGFEVLVSLSRTMAGPPSPATSLIYQISIRPWLFDFLCLQCLPQAYSPAKGPYSWP